jgi:hypothetical protein
MARFLATTGGLPRLVDETKDPKDAAVLLLRIAAEVEHTLMVEYLYAGFSLGPGADPIYQQTLIDIAKQEMGHLVTVENLLTLLGADPHLDRDGLLPQSGKEPGPFLLEPVSPSSLAKYVVVESPLNEVIEKNPQDAAIYDRATKVVGDKGMDQLNRVGALYTLIYWIFMETDQPRPDEPWPLDPKAVLERNPELKGVHLKDSDFRPAAEVSDLLAIPNEWKVNVDTIYVENTVDRQSAKKALFKISAQGEGISDDPSELSHFQRFLALFAAAENQAPSILKVPVVNSAQLPDPGQSVTAYFNTRYQILLVLIDLVFRFPSGQSPRTDLARTAHAEMVSGIRELARAMLNLSGAPTNGPVAPPFELPTGPWPKDSFPNAGAAVTQLQQLLAQSKTIESNIRTNWPELIGAQLNTLKIQNARIEQALGKIPTS